VYKPLKSVTHGQCDAGPMITFPTAGHHCPATGTRLYCMVTEAHVCEQLAQGCYLAVEGLGVDLTTELQANALTITSQGRQITMPVRHQTNFTGPNRQCQSTNNSSFITLSPDYAPALFPLSSPIGPAPYPFCDPCLSTYALPFLLLLHSYPFLFFPLFIFASVFLLLCKFTIY